MQFQNTNSLSQYEGKFHFTFLYTLYLDSECLKISISHFIKMAVKKPLLRQKLYEVPGTTRSGERNTWAETVTMWLSTACCEGCRSTGALVSGEGPQLSLVLSNPEVRAQPGFFRSRGETGTEVQRYSQDHSAENGKRGLKSYLSPPRRLT